MSGIPKAQPGDKYGALTLIEDTGRRNTSGSVYWRCKCECGNYVTRAWDVITVSLIRGHRISCGCQNPANKAIYENNKDNPKRIERYYEGIGQIDGTTIAGICRHNINKNNTSGVRGVTWSKREKKWRARLVIAGKEHCSYFNTKEKAIAYRKHLEETYFAPVVEKYNEQKGAQK